MRSAKRERSRLARPITAFCSWMAVGMREHARGDDRRQRRIAAEADDGARVDLLEQTQRADEADAEAGEGLDHGNRAAARQRRRRDAVNGARRELDAIFLGADVGRELDLVAAALQLLRQGSSGKQMPARAPRSEQDRARGQAACSLMEAASESGWACVLRFSRPAMGRLRVRPRAKPMVSAMASSEEPP